MPVKAWDTHHAAQLLTCCALMLALAHPVSPSSRSAVTAPAAPVTPPTVQSPPAPVATPPTVPSAPITPVAPATDPNKHLVWDINYILWAPDCKQHGMIGINGEFPGPTIDASEGDTITVVVNNKLHTEGVVIHWHGIRQKDTPWADGTASISQCPINPGETFTYKFTVDKPGTYFYHGHFGMQRAAGLYGSLIVHEKVDPYKKEPKYGGELNMLLSDWYHEAVYAQAAGLERKDDHFQWVGEPQSVLINGTGQFGCTLGDVGKFELGIHRHAKKCDRKEGQLVEAACDKNCGPGGKAVTDSCIKSEHCDGKTGEEKGKCVADCTTKGEESDEEKNKVVCEDEKKTNCSTILRSECGPFCRETQCGPVTFHVEPDKMYRLRIASTTSLSALSVQVEEHKLTVVEADGNLVEPVDVESLDIYSGESYSVLLNTTAAKQGSSPYWISVGVIGRKPKTLPALAVLRYSSNNKADLPDRPTPATPAWNDTERSKDFAKKLKARAGSSGPVPKADRRIDMLNIQDMVNNQIKWAINHVSLELPATPYLGAYLYNIEGQVFNTAALPDTYINGYDIHKPPQEQELTVRTATVVSNQVYALKHGEVVDVVLQNADMRTDNVSESHPWHLHGHDFWVLGYGDDKYEPETAVLDVEKPPLRNTVVLFPHGWTVIRFKADNPGVWAFHCHIEPHLHMGMGVVFAEGMDEKGMKSLKEDVPREAMMCGKTAVAAAPPLAPATPPPSP